MAGLSWASVLGVALAAVLVGVQARADSVVTTALHVQSLAPGVYTIRHPDPTDDFPDGNTTVVIGERSVLVIDSGYLASTARGDIERIRSWTPLPVRYVVNTHWHIDHNGGNDAYAQAWPGVAFVAHHETRTMMDARNRSYVARLLADDSAFAAQRAARRRLADTGLDAEGKPADAAAREAARRALAREAQAMLEFRRFVYQPPTLTFDHELNIDLGGRTVELRFLGRGNTAGDVVAWLPDERILVAGDLVDHPVPYAFGGYPSEWTRTLRRLAALDARVIVPGHGAVLRDAQYLNRVIALFEDVQRQVNALVDRRGSAATADETIRSVDLSAARRQMAGDDADSQEFFDASMASLIRLVFAEVKAR